MTTREQAAEKWHNDRYVKMIPSPFPFDKYNHAKQGYEDFLAGCAHVDREHREYYVGYDDKGNRLFEYRKETVNVNYEV